MWNNFTNGNPACTDRGQTEPIRFNNNLSTTDLCLIFFQIGRKNLFDSQWKTAMHMGMSNMTSAWPLSKLRAAICWITVEDTYDWFLPPPEGILSVTYDTIRV